MLILITGGSSCGKSAFAEKLAAEMKNKMRDKTAEQTAPRMIYIATMEPFSEDAAKKMEHHHELRAGKGFVTLEQYTAVERAIPKLEEISGAEEGTLRTGDTSDAERKISKSGASHYAERKIRRSGESSDAERKVSNPADFYDEERKSPKPVVLLECLSNLLANEMFAPDVTEEMRRQPAFESSMCQKICAGLRSLEKAASCLIVVSCNVGEDGASYAWETVKYIHILGKLQAELARGAEQVYEVVCGIPVVLKEK